MMNLLLSVSSRSSLRASLRGSVPSVVANQLAAEPLSAGRFYSWEVAGGVILTGEAEVVSKALRSCSSITITTGAEILSSPIRESVSPTITTGALRIQRAIYQAVVLGGDSPPSE